jgi:hypothetical protein
MGMPTHSPKYRVNGMAMVDLYDQRVRVPITEDVGDHITREVGPGELLAGTIVDHVDTVVTLSLDG